MTEEYVDHFKVARSVPIPAPPKANPLRKVGAADSSAFRTVCKRHPFGSTGEPCRTCRQIARRSASPMVCYRHPDGDTGAPCHTCREIRLRNER